MNKHLIRAGIPFAIAGAAILAALSGCAQDTPQGTGGTPPVSVSPTIDPSVGTPAGGPAPADGADGADGSDGGGSGGGSGGSGSGSSGGADSSGEAAMEGAIYLSQRDVRELQFAKAAIATGWRLLLEEHGLTDADVAQVLLAGSFGSYLSPASAVRIGLVPDVSVLRIVSAGNVAGEGAKMALLSKMKINGLRAAYTRTTGKPANRLGRDALIKTLAAHDDTAPAAKAPAAEEPTTTKAKRRTGLHDPRLPAAGTVIERTYKDKVHKVRVGTEGFEYAGKTYRSLTAAAKAATGYPSISGTLFWGIAKPAAAKKG